MKYGLKLAPPEPFYAECHRPSHFANFSQSEDAEETLIDLDDFYA